MERLTIRDKDGLLAHSRFKGDWASQNILQSLADYEDAEEQGLLLKLPCKAGDILYIANIEKGKVFEFTAMVLKAPEFPKNYFVPGRMAMTCCADDMT